jgi:hypothetical protein
VLPSCFDSPSASKRYAGLVNASREESLEQGFDLDAAKWATR